MFKKIASDTLRTRIAKQIRDAILSGTLKEGSKLVERNLATELGASLTAVREGLIELEWEGFIVKKKNSGTHVIKLSPADVEKVFEARAVIEAHAFASAAANATPGDIEELAKAYDDMLEAARNRDARLYNQKDVAFHSAVWRSTHNDFLEAALKRAVLPYFSYTAIRIGSVNRSLLDRDAAGHLPLLVAIQSHNPEAARQAFQQSINDWLAIARCELEAEGKAAAAPGEERLSGTTQNQGTRSTNSTSPNAVGV
jgi:DNA-binding GntR family transcriptional regulator